MMPSSIYPHPELVEGRTELSAFVYILRCADDSYYVGSTRASLEERMSQHDAGTFGGYTARRRPVRLVFQQEFDRITDAIAAERQLKGWTRAKKEALIRGDFDALRTLSKKRAAAETVVRPSTSSG
jgi:putative endonuclease